MVTVTIYKQTIQDAAREACEEDPGETAMEEMEAYIDNLTKSLKATGYEVEREDVAPSPGPCYGVASDDASIAGREEEIQAWAWLENWPGYWEWQ